MSTCTDDQGLVWSWGSNKGGALGRPKSLGENFPAHGYAPKAGRVEGFSGWGKGLPASIACGPSATVVALLPWEGPDEETVVADSGDRIRQLALALAQALASALILIPKWLERVARLSI